MKYDNYSRPVLIKSIEVLETLPKPLPGPIHNTLNELRKALVARNESTLKQASPEQLGQVLEALEVLQKQSNANIAGERWLGRRND